MKHNKSLTVMTVVLAALSVLAVVVAMGRTATPVRALPVAARAESGVSRSINTGCQARVNDGVVYPTIQGAVDASTDPNDVIKVAGHCSATNNYGGLSQVIYLSKTLTLRGGYTTTDWLVADPGANPTTLDAQENGRVIYIVGAISPTIEGVSLTGGQPPAGSRNGGGVCVVTAAVTISDSRIFGNQARTGGGLYLVNGRATLISNTVTGNNARSCGGIAIDQSDAHITGNSILSNSADTNGGGLCIWDSTASLDVNTVAGNTADLQWGGGIYMYWSDAVLVRNTIKANTVDDSYGSGGGMAVLESSVILSDNVIQSNSADVGGGLLLLLPTLRSAATRSFPIRPQAMAEVCQCPKVRPISSTTRCHSTPLQYLGAGSPYGRVCTSR